MSANIIKHFIETRDFNYGSVKEKLNEIMDEHTKKACVMLNINLVNIIIWPNSDAVIPETGEGGQVWSKELVMIYIDPSRSVAELQKIIETQIPATIYHELNHIARGNFLSKEELGFHHNLSKAVISEGIASYFAHEKWSQAQMPWTKYSETEIQDLLSIYLSRDISDDDQYDHEKWFYGTGDLPRWIGYKLGYYFVERYKKQNPNVSWSDIIKLKDHEFMKTV
ncbi:MAG: DUF2268 domain-containing putative Zn-dependent protease [Parcubacteria group bacterium]|jgi:uncharacterized protein YjaZ